MGDITIMVIDDNVLSIELFKDLLEVSGYNVVLAYSASEAIDMLKTIQKPDLILTDIQLPGLDGIGLTRILKTSDETKNIPVVAITAHAMKGDEEKFLEAGCNGYIAKPISTRDFVSKVEMYLNKE